MHPKGLEMINKVLKNKRVLGPNKDCEYFPCHDVLEDCTFCYCPFYPCYQEETGGFEKLNSRTGKPVWSCSSCIFPHKLENAKKILKGLIEFNSEFNLISRDKLLELQKKISNQKCE